MSEEALVFGRDRSLVGVLSRPDGPADLSRPALIAVNAGLVHRVGPQRLHVGLLRRMATLGFTGLRFDFSGVGDSLPRRDLLPYTRSALEEVGEAMDAVTARTGIERFCILGLSSGALVAMAAAGVDPRVAGVCMLNPHGFGTSSVWGEHVEMLHVSREYTRNLVSLRSWAKLLSGRTNYRRMFEAVRQRLAGPSGARAELQAVAAGARPVLTHFFSRRVPTLMLFSQHDRSRRNFDEILGPGWHKGLDQRIEVAEIIGANHTLAAPAHQREAIAAIEQWLLRGWPGGQADDRVPAGGRERRPQAAVGATSGGAHEL